MNPDPANSDIINQELQLDSGQQPNRRSALPNQRTQQVIFQIPPGHPPSSFQPANIITKGQFLHTYTDQVPANPTQSTNCSSQPPNDPAPVEIDLAVALATEKIIKLESELYAVKKEHLSVNREYFYTQKGLLEVEEQFLDKIWEVEANESYLKQMEKNNLRGKINGEFGMKIEAQKLIVHKAKMALHQIKNMRHCLEVEIRILSVANGLCAPKTSKKKKNKNKNKKKRDPLMVGIFCSGPASTIGVPKENIEKTIYKNMGDEALDVMDQEEPSELGNKMIKVL